LTFFETQDLGKSFSTLRVKGSVFTGRGGRHESKTADHRQPGAQAAGREKDVAEGKGIGGGLSPQKGSPGRPWGKVNRIEIAPPPLPGRPNPPLEFYDAAV